MAVEVAETYNVPVVDALSNIFTIKQRNDVNSTLPHQKVVPYTQPRVINLRGMIKTRWFSSCLYKGLNQLFKILPNGLMN